jgi:phage repressor protein C with HTH and peptisase S24 domain
MNTLSDRLREAMRELNLSNNRALADFCEVSEGLVTQWFSGQTKLGPKPLKAFSRTNFNLDWLTTGKLPKYRDSFGAHADHIGTSAEIDLSNNPDYPAIRRVKLHLSAGISGFGVEMEEEDHAPLVFGAYWYKSRGYNPKNLIGIRVKGDSMMPGINDDDTVVINTADTTPVDGEAFAINYEGEAVVKRLVRDAGEWWLSSDNPDQRRYSRKLCSGDACIIIGRIVHKQSEKI